MPLRAGLLALAVCAGCSSTNGLGPGPIEGPDPPPLPPSPELIIVEEEFLDAGLALEFGDRHADALEHYASALAPDSQVTPRLLARAHLRSAACLIRLKREAEAVPHLHAVLRSVYVAPADDFPAPQGGARAPLRRDAEGRLRDAGDDPFLVYQALLTEGTGGAKLIAVVSLACLAETRARALLEETAADASAAPALRELAREELSDWGKRQR